MIRKLALIALLATLVGLCVWSYVTGGLVRILISGMSDVTGGIEALRAYVRSWGALAPIVYVVAVVIEVLVAPIPGALLYAPSGAIFGALAGGALSLTGNVLGATLACLIGRALGARVLDKRARSPLGRYEELVKRRGVWVVLLLRINPLTSSDLVSYAAGVAGVPIQHVALGTLCGMAPLCFAQAYLAERIFRWGWFGLIAVGVVYLVALVVIVRRR